MGFLTRRAQTASKRSMPVGYVRLAWGLRVVAIAAVLILVTGCDRTTGQRLTHWTLDGPGIAAQPIDLPVHLNGELPNRLLTYRLTTTVRLDAPLVGLAVFIDVAREKLQLTRRLLRGFKGRKPDADQPYPDLDIECFEKRHRDARDRCTRGDG